MKKWAEGLDEMATQTDLLSQWRQLWQKYLLSKFISLRFNAAGLALCFPVVPLSVTSSEPVHNTFDEHFLPLNHVPIICTPDTLFKGRLLRN